MNRKPTSPAFDLEAEAALLGAILLESEATEIAFGSGLVADDFYDPRHREIAGIARQLYEAQQRTDTITVSDELERRGALARAGGRMYVFETAERIPTAARLRQHLDIVLDNSLRRALASVSIDLFEASESAPAVREGGVKPIASLISRKLQAMLERRSGERGLRPIGEFVPGFIEKLRAPKTAGRHRGISSGLEALDAAISGFTPGQLIVIAGRPGMGKTSAAITIASNVAFEQREPAPVVAFFSLEMAGEEITERLCCAQTGLNEHLIRIGAITETIAQEAEEKLSGFSRLRLYIDGRSSHTALSIEQELGALERERGRIDLIAVDYLQLIRVPGAENRAAAVAEITRQLKAIARRFQCPLIAMSQLNRDSEREHRRPRLSDLRESGSIEQDADVVILIHREDYHKPASEKDGSAEFIVAKQRMGPTGLVNLRFDEVVARFRDIDWNKAR